jgi:hypothetical protein
MRVKNVMIALGIQLQIVGTDEGSVELHIQAANQTFTGALDVHSWEEQIAQAASTLAGFPTRFGDEREIEFGTTVPEHVNGWAHFRFRCTSATGRAFAETTLRSRDLVEGLRETLTLAIPVEAAAVDLFVRDLLEMTRTQTGTAVLRSPIW